MSLQWTYFHVNLHRRGALDTVQQYPHQTAEVRGMNEGVHPMPYAAGVNYPQGYFPPSENQYSRPFLFSSLISHHLATPIRFDQWFLPHVLQPQSQIFLPLYHQYRNQVMMPGAVQQVTRFPSAAVQPSQFWPQVYQVLQGPSSYTYPPVPFYGNPIQRAQESSSVLRDAKSPHPQNILAHASPSLEFSSPAMVLGSSPVGVWGERRIWFWGIVVYLRW